MAKELKIPVDADTARARNQLRELRGEADKTTEAGSAIGGKMAAGFQSAGREALSLVGSLTGISLSLGGIVTLAKQFLDHQKQIIDNMADAARQEGAAAAKRAADASGATAARMQSELGISMQGQQRMAADWARATGRDPNEFRGVALELGGIEGTIDVGRFAALTGIQDATSIPDMLEWGMGATTEDDRFAAMSKFAALVKSKRLEDAGMVAAVMQDRGAAIREQTGQDPLAVIAALSKRYGSRRARAIAGQIAEGNMPAEMDGLQGDIEENTRIMAGANPDTMRDMWAAYYNSPEVQRRLAYMETGEEATGGYAGAAARVDEIGNRLFNEAGASAREEVMRLVQEKGLSREQATTMVKMGMVRKNQAARLRARRLAGDSTAAGLEFYSEQMGAYSDRDFGTGFLPMQGRDTKANSLTGAMVNVEAMLDRPVNVGVIYASPPSRLAENERTRGD